MGEGLGLGPRSLCSRNVYYPFPLKPKSKEGKIKACCKKCNRLLSYSFKHDLSFNICFSALANCAEVICSVVSLAHIYFNSLAEGSLGNVVYLKLDNSLTLQAGDISAKEVAVDGIVYMAVHINVLILNASLSYKGKGN